MEPDKRFTGFSAFHDYVDSENTTRADIEKCIDEEMMPFALLSDDSLAEPGRTQTGSDGKLVVVDIELERGVDGYPRLPPDLLQYRLDFYPNMGLLSFKKRIIRELIRTTYRT